MIRTDKRMRLCTALLICNLVFIWGNSLLPGEVSGAVSDCVRQILEELVPGGAKEELGGGRLRKLAHFTEFTALGLLLGWLFGMLKKKQAWSVLCGISAACMDETIQRFVPGRGPSIKDVCIDSCGVLTGLILLYLGHTYLKRKHKK
ncbi:MAG: VanZ family protein [Oscillospiraceae bacterium]|nr:VanZ family protein [Oscillospiraceae bacterium]